MHVHVSSTVMSFDDRCYCNGNKEVRVIAVRDEVPCVRVHVCVYMSSMDVIHLMIKVAATVVGGQSIYLKVRPQTRHDT